MTQFAEREEAFENKFSHDEETEFKILARMAHLFGLWAAGKLGLTGAEAAAYADACLDIELTHDWHVTLIAKAEKDFATKGISITRHHIEREMEECYGKARAQTAG